MFAPIGFWGSAAAANTHQLDFERASSQYLTFVPGAARTDLGTTMTVEFWFTPETVPGTGERYEFLSRYGQSGSGERCFNFSILESAGVVYMRATAIDAAGGLDQYQVALGDITQDVAEYYAVTVDVGNASATTFEFFVAGVSVGNGSALATSNISAIATGAETQPTYIGDLALDNNPVSLLGSNPDGKLDELRIWSDVRTAQEIADNMSVELVGDEAGLWLYAKFNNDLTDDGPNAFTISENNGPIAFAEPGAF
jgi:hypothetical protein